MSFRWIPPHLLYNENFNCTEFDIIKNMSGNNNFVLSVDNILIKLSFFFITLRMCITSSQICFIHYPTMCDLRTTPNPNGMPYHRRWRKPTAW